MDLDKIKQIISLMNDNDLSEIEVEEKEKDKTFKVKVKKGQEFFEVPKVVSIPAPAVNPHGQLQDAPPRIETTQPTEPTIAEKKNYIEITSPMVGTFYRAGSPDAEPYVEVDAKVEPETVVCIIEAMKVMNEIRAEVEGEVAEIFVDNGEPVEYGQVMFLIRPAAETNGQHSRD